MVFDRIGRIKAPDPWKDPTSIMSYGVHINRSPVDGEGVGLSPYMVWVPVGCSQGFWVDGAR